MATSQPTAAIDRKRHATLPSLSAAMRGAALERPRKGTTSLRGADWLGSREWFEQNDATFVAAMLKAHPELTTNYRNALGSGSISLLQKQDGTHNA